MSVAAVDFDPYRDWLKIPDRTRPLNPYQLLRLAPLEGDLTKIRAAYGRQAEVLERRAASDDEMLVQNLMSEVQRAFDVLRDADQKRVLDAQLRRDSRASVPQPSAETQATAGPAVQCRKCHKANPASRRFCGGCGQPLWEKCPQCSAECAADEQFCGACGTDIRGELDGQAKLYESDLAAARKAAEEFRFDAAISRFRRLAAIEDLRFAHLAQEALAGIAAAERSRDELVAHMARQLKMAQDHVAARAYEAAIVALQEVKPAVRSPEVNELLEQAQSARHELLQLSGEIRQEMEAKRYTGLLLKIERLLTLKPGHAQAQSIAGQLRDHFLKLAKARLTTFQYTEAAEILEQIPPFVRTEAVETLTDTALELTALQTGVQEAASAEPTLLALAEKLCRFAPQNEELAKLKQRVANRLTKSPATPRQAWPDWQPSPIKTPLGPPVEALAYFTRIEARDESITAKLKEHPGEFFVALGLALQGIEQAEVPLNLMAVEKGSVLARIKSVFSDRSPTEAWGIDLGDAALKAIKLARHPKSGEIHIAACEHVVHDAPIAGVDADLVRNSLQEKTLAEFVSRVKLNEADPKSVCQIIASLPAQRVLGRFCELPPLPAKKVSQTVQFEARHQFPIPLEELNWAYYVLGEADGKSADESPRRVLVMAARSTHVNERVQLFKRAGIELSALQSECVALHNAVRYEFGGDDDQADGSQAIAIFDVGVSSTSAIISAPRSLWFRTFGQAGQNVTTQLTKLQQLTQDQAEAVKRNPAKAKRYYQFCAVTEPVLQQLAGEFERSLHSYRKQYAQKAIGRIYGVGGGFRTPGLMKRLRFGK